MRGPTILVLGFLVIAALALVPNPTIGHAPRINDGASTPAESQTILDPEKSWAIYDRLQPSEKHHHNIQGPTQLNLRIYTPHYAQGAPTVTLHTPDGTTIPATPVVPRTTFDPFTPQALRHVATLEATLGPGRHAVTIDWDQGGAYAFSFGQRESLTPTEHITIPFARIQIHLWESQPWIAILGMELVTTTALLAWLRPTAKQWLPTAAAGLHIGSGLGLILQTTIATVRAGWTPSIVVPLILATIAIYIGLGIRASSRAGHPKVTAVLAIVGLLTWSGIVVGPLLAALWAAWPGSDHQKQPQTGTTP